MNARQQHFPLWKGVRILFAGEDGGVCSCYVEGIKNLEKTDLTVASLNAELTPNINPAKILPPDYEKCLGDAGGLPIVTFNQREQVTLTELKDGIMKVGIIGRPPHDPRWLRFNHMLTVGDSGNPSFFLFGKEAVLVSLLHVGGAGGGPGIHLYRREIQAAMDELCPGYKLESFDFKTCTEQTAE